MLFEFKPYFPSEAYSEPSQKPKMERFVKIFDRWKPLIIFGKCSILDVWLGSEYASAYNELPSTPKSLIILIRSPFYHKKSEYNLILSPNSGQTSEKKVVRDLPPPISELGHLQLESSSLPLQHSTDNMGRPVLDWYYFRENYHTIQGIGRAKTCD